MGMKPRTVAASVTLAGVGVIAAGLWFVYPPLAVIVVGLTVAITGLLAVEVTR